MPKLTGTIRIDASPGFVWDVLSDYGGVKKFNPVVKDSSIVGEVERGVGAERQCALAPFGSVRERVTSWEEGKSFTIRIVETSGGAPPLKQGNGKLEVIPAGDGSQVRMTLDYEIGLGPIGKLMDLLMVRRQFTGAIERTLSGLKQYVEAGEGPVTAATRAAVN